MNIHKNTELVSHLVLLFEFSTFTIAISNVLNDDVTQLFFLLSDEDLAVFFFLDDVISIKDLAVFCFLDDVLLWFPFVLEDVAV